MTTGADEEVESLLASDRRLYGASFHRIVDGKKVRVPPWEVRVTGDGLLLDKVDRVVHEQIGETPPLHYGPVHGRPVGQTMALCKPTGPMATMTNSWPAVTCGKCLDQRTVRALHE